MFSRRQKRSGSHAKSTFSSLREEPRQINVILQQKLPTAKLSAVCTIYHSKGSAKSKINEKRVNWIENEGENLYKRLKMS